MFTRRGSLAILVLVGLLGTAGGVAIAVLYRPLPDPAVAGRDDLLRWLVTRDLTQESAETRGVLARRLEEEYGTRFDASSAADRLDEAQRQRVWDNVVVLLEPWFLDKVQRYSALPDPQRLPYLDRLLDMLAAWRSVDQLLPEMRESPAGQGGRRGLLEVLLARLPEWRQQAPAPKRKQIDDFLLAVQARWFWRSLQSLAPKAGV